MKIKLLVVAATALGLGSIVNACGNGTYRDYTLNNNLERNIEMVLYETDIFGRWPTLTIEVPARATRKFCSTLGGGWNQVFVARDGGRDLCESVIANRIFQITIMNNNQGQVICVGRIRPINLIQNEI